MIRYTAILFEVYKNISLLHTTGTCWDKFLFLTVGANILKRHFYILILINFQLLLQRVGKLVSIDLEIICHFIWMLWNAPLFVCLPSIWRIFPDTQNHELKEKVKMFYFPVSTTKDKRKIFCLEANAYFKKSFCTMPVKLLLYTVIEWKIFCWWEVKQWFVL